MVLDPTIARCVHCRYCSEDKKFSKKSDLLDHYNTPKHTRNEESAKNNGTYIIVNEEGHSLEQRTKLQGMRIARFAADCNFAIRLVDFLVPFTLLSLDNV